MRLKTFLVSSLILSGSLSAFAGESINTPPWKGQYKIKPHETNRMTPADVLGPDGIVYPNWTKCGVQGGISDVKVVTSIEKFGAKSGDNTDDSQALSKACEAAGKMGGGAVLLGEGTYYLDRPVTVRYDNVVIRGEGTGKTRLIFRYATPANSVAFYSPAAGSTVGPNTRIEMHSTPADLAKMTIMIDDAAIGTWTRGKHSGNTFNFAVSGRNAVGKVANGKHTLKGVAEYKDGSKLTGEIPIVFDSAFKDSRPVADSRAAITFAGKGTVGGRLKLTADGKRGDMKLKLRRTEGLRVGDCIRIDAPATDRWKKLTKNACLWGSYRMYELVVTGIKGKTVTVNQPLRIEFPIIDGAYVQKLVPIKRCGIEKLSIEQTENLWISSVVFYNGWN
ncbi:MAG: glycosyl hydrolase family 28-related protein, partial [Planctomycetota bacterium]|nr:glycosyl hydrolase family 28-related protein [Planctomycetota bacterium]